MLTLADLAQERRERLRVVEVLREDDFAVFDFKIERRLCLNLLVRVFHGLRSNMRYSYRLIAFDNEVSRDIDEYLIGLREASHHRAQSLTPFDMTSKLLVIDRVSGEQ